MKKQNYNMYKIYSFHKINTLYLVSDYFINNRMNCDIINRYLKGIYELIKNKLIKVGTK